MFLGGHLMLGKRFLECYMLMKKCQVLANAVADFKAKPSVAQLPPSSSELSETWVCNSVVPVGDPELCRSVDSKVEQLLDRHHNATILVTSSYIKHPVSSLFYPSLLLCFPPLTSAPIHHLPSHLALIAATL